MKQALKKQLVAQIESGQITATEAARTHSISPPVISYWRKQFQAGELSEAPKSSFKGNGKVYTQVIRNCSKKEILPLTTNKISKASTIYTDGFKTYDGLVDMGYKKLIGFITGKMSLPKKKRG